MSDQDIERDGEDVDTDELMTRVARELGRNAQVEVVFGEPVERGDVTVIPVATASLGLGGSTGAAASPGGIGAGLRVTPVGYIEIANGTAQFRRVLPTWAFVTIAVSLGAMLGLLLFSQGD